MFRTIGLNLLYLSLFYNLLYAQSHDINCFTILVGKNASFDGSVLLAHNEDDFGKNLVNWYKVPFLNHNENETIELFAGGEISQASKTNEFFWLEMPGMHFSDSYINEYGVTIVSDACRSKEDSAELVDGGIGYYLRRIIAERAESAKQGVKIAGAIVDSIGYASSGRTYCIADPNEAWMMSIVKGKHWIAQRIPDDHIAIIPNYYTIGEINLLDTLNYLGSEDIVEYAIERGWYNPDSEGEFIFRNAYGKNSSIKSMVNITRHWGAVNLLSNQQYELTATFPFSFEPKNKITIQNLMDVLEFHYEGTELEVQNEKSPHIKNIIPKVESLPICRKDTQYGMIAQLRDWLPSDIGNVMWLAPYRPCSQVFIPWYYGISEIPSYFAEGEYKSALENHFDKNIIENSPGHTFWEYVSFSDRVDSNYYNLINDITIKKNNVQKTIFNQFNAFEKEINKYTGSNVDVIGSRIDSFTNQMISISLDYLK